MPPLLMMGGEFASRQYWLETYQDSPINKRSSGFGHGGRWGRGASPPGFHDITASSARVNVRPNINWLAASRGEAQPPLWR
ncbi:MAG: hypothetical protein H6667_12540 [Ardenticatenaceae bacterium]|nr:hypothetical protein [Ardenticatenaceae bacterium]